MPKYILKRQTKYRHKKNKDGVDVIPLYDREVSFHIFNQYEEVVK